MDHETNEQEPPSTEGGQVNYRVGDKVWVRAKVAHNSDSSEYMELDHNGYEIIAHKSDCRPDELYWYGFTDTESEKNKPKRVDDAGSPE